MTLQILLINTSKLDSESISSQYSQTVEHLWWHAAVYCWSWSCEFEKLGDNGTWLYSTTVYIWFPFSQLNDYNNSDCAATANCPHLTLMPKCCWRSHFTHLKNKNKMFGILISTWRRSLWLTPSLQYDVIFFPTCFQAAMSFANVLDPSLLLWTTVWVTVQKYKHPIGQLCHLVVRNPHF